MSNRSMKLLLTAVLLAAFVFLIGRNRGGLLGDSAQEIKYSRLQEQIQQNNVKQGEFIQDEFRGEYITPPRSDQSKSFRVNLGNSPATQADLEKSLRENKVPYTFSRPLFSDKFLGVVLPLVLPLLFLGFLWFMFMRQAQAGGNQAISFGRSRAKRMGDNVPKVTFDHVAGVDEAKEELAEIVDFLKNAAKFRALGAKIPKGVLLLGPPGCGKTLLARAIAGEAGVPFFHISGSDFVEMFVGVGASRVRDLFETAKASRPSLIFIDEIDAVGRQRGAGLGGGHDEREQTLNQLLVEMDGFDANSGVILLAATNRPDVLDPALRRPGRFDRTVVVDAPDMNGRKEIIKVHLKGKPLEFGDDGDGANLAAEELARKTPGFTGADLANVINEAALLAARRDKTKIGLPEFHDSIDRVMMGPERKSRILNQEARERIALHEAGHAIVGELLEGADPTNKVSILPRGMALGYTLSLPTEDRFLHSSSEMEADIAALLGGRAAESLFHDDTTTGASNDLDRATAMARSMVCEYGMSRELGPVRLGRRHGNPFLGRDYMEDRDYSEDVARKIDTEVRSIIDRNYDVARNLLESHRDIVDAVVAALMEHETIDRPAFLELMGGHSAHTSNNGHVAEAPVAVPADEQPQQVQPHIS